MKSQEIINKLTKMIEDIKQENILEKLTNIVISLEYLYYTIDKERKKLDVEDSYYNSKIIREKIMDLCAELVKQYIKIKYNKYINIKRNNKISLAIANGGYNVKEDTIEYLMLGLMIGAKNETEYIQTFLHEARHKIQHDLYRESQITEILKYPPHMIILAKEEAFQTAHEDEGKEIYAQNYDKVHFEIDAEIFALDSLHWMLWDLFKLYKDEAKKNKIEVDKQLEEKVQKIIYTMKSQAIELEKMAKETGKINVNLVDETYGKSPIESTYKVGDEEIDRLIATDQYIKKHPEIQTTMPIFKLIFTGDRPKTYDEIIEEKKMLLLLFGQNQELTLQIERLYRCIIISDPILYLTNLVRYNEKEKLSIFLDKHPTIFLEYPKEIQTIINRCSDEEIFYILTSKQKNSKKR